MSVAAHLLILLVDLVASGLIIGTLIARRRLRKAREMVIAADIAARAHAQIMNQMQQVIVDDPRVFYAAGGGGAGIALGAGLGGGAFGQGILRAFEVIPQRNAWKSGTLQQAHIPGGIEHRDAEGRFHREDGPALEFLPGVSGLQHGAQYWYWHGLECSPETILNPAAITIDAIDNHIRNRNQVCEPALAMIDRYIGHDQNDGLRGEHRYVRDSIERGLVDVIDSDERFGTLVRKRLGPYDSPIVMVVVKNRTPEDDGSFKTHYLRVPPDVKTARGAVGWSFGLSARRYTPIKES